MLFDGSRRDLKISYISSLKKGFIRVSMARVFEKMTKTNFTINCQLWRQLEQKRNEMVEMW